jgi:hypothetical protein
MTVLMSLANFSTMCPWKHVNSISVFASHQLLYASHIGSQRIEEQESPKLQLAKWLFNQVVISFHDLSTKIDVKTTALA